MFLTLWLPDKVWAYLSLIFFGMGPMVWTITTTTLRQTVTPNRLLGRATAVILTVSFGARPVGAGIAALVALYWDTQTCLYLVLLGFGGQFLLVFFSPLRRLKALPDAYNESGHADE